MTASIDVPSPESPSSARNRDATEDYRIRQARRTDDGRSELRRLQDERDACYSAMVVARCERDMLRTIAADGAASGDGTPGPLDYARLQGALRLAPGPAALVGRHVRVVYSAPWEPDSRSQWECGACGAEGPWVDDVQLARAEGYAHVRATAARDTARYAVAEMMADLGDAFGSVGYVPPAVIGRALASQRASTRSGSEVFRSASESALAGEAASYLSHWDEDVDAQYDGIVAEIVTAMASAAASGGVEASGGDGGWADEYAKALAAFQRGVPLEEALASACESHDTVDVALADRALATGARRHTPVASNHYPGARHGVVQLHSYPTGAERWSVAVLFPPECDDDPTAGLWWVLVEEVTAAIGTYYALVSATGEERSDFASIEEATRWLAGRIGLHRSDLILVDRSSSGGSELKYEVLRTEDSEPVGTVGEAP